MAALLFALGIAACTPEPSSEVLIQGVIEAPRTSEARIDSHAARLDENGVFVLRFDLDEPALVRLDVGGTIPMFLAPGDRIDLRTRGDDVLGALEWKGANAHVNQYLVEEAMRSAREGGDSLLALPRAAFLARVDTLEAAANARLDAFLAAHHAVPLAFEPLGREVIRSRWAKVRLEYPDPD